MAGTGIYLIMSDNDLVEMTETPFENEELFQVLLARYPRVLGGDQFDSENPRRWLLITREAPIPAVEEGADRWAVDHLFVDENAVPTFVEVKRSTDTRIRREVIGQMLDYAAHALATWRTGRLRSFFEEQCLDRDTSEVFSEAMGEGRDIEEFWQAVTTNLQAGRVRLVFVADIIPPELRRVIEFLNKQMNPAEVLGIEIRQYVGGGLQTLVPRVIGQSAETLTGKTSVRGQKWDEQRFFEAPAIDASSDLKELARELLAFGEEISGRPVDWGTGKERGSFTVAIRIGKERLSLFSVYSTAEFSMNMGWSNYRLERAGLTISEKFRAKVNDELGLNFDREVWEHSWAVKPLALLLPKAAEFKRVIAEVVAEAKASLSASRSSEV